LRRIDSGADFFGRGRLATFRDAGSDVKEGNFPMTFASRLSIVAAYVAFAFVGAIVLGVF
jgi:hypothetical protein